MTSDWEFLTNTDEETFGDITSLLPSSLHDVWDTPPSQEELESHRYARSPPTSRHSGSLGHNSRPFPFAESAPAFSFMDDTDGAVPSSEPTVEVEDNPRPKKNHFFLVQFHPNRSELYKWNRGGPIEKGAYVVTEADRGYDIGLVIQEVQRPSQREAKNAKYIVRPASSHEISQLPQKLEREKRAQELCQQKAEELQLPMHITGAEFQFDGKKLTFYYNASSYVDFRSLVRSLYKNYGMRIWMVWHDGSAPVRDVLNRTATQ